MTARIHKLTAKQVENMKAPGRHADGGGLYLVVSPAGSRKWVLRYQVAGRRHDLGLGSLDRVGLARAREIAHAARRQLGDGLDPIAERRKARRRVPTFEEAARAYHTEHKDTWKNTKHAAQWLSTLEAYAFPHIGEATVDKITGPDVHDLLARIWLTTPETARRVRQRIGTVLDWTAAKGWRADTLDMRSVSRGLPRQKAMDRHHAALDWQAVPSFIASLRASDASPSVRLGFEFLILTATRSGEVREARWSEVDLDAKRWTIPASRMKAGREHVVPLSDRAVAILKEAAKFRREPDADGLIFEGAKPGKPMSDMTLTQYLRRAGVNATAHGFRSSFRDWVSEQTSFSREVAEAALAHVERNKVVRAYARSDLLEHRRKLMQAWSSFCDGGIAGNVVALRAEGA